MEKISVGTKKSLSTLTRKQLTEIVNLLGEDINLITDVNSSNKRLAQDIHEKCLRTKQLDSLVEILKYLGEK